MASIATSRGRQDRPIARLVRRHGEEVLWFGGIYPWFDARGLVDAVAMVNRRLSTRLVIVGARNPFNFHPDLLAKYQELADYVRRPEFAGLVIMQDWVDFHRRADWYLDADLLVTINRPGDENAPVLEDAAGQLRLGGRARRDQRRRSAGRGSDRRRGRRQAAPASSPSRWHGRSARLLDEPEMHSGPSDRASTPSSRACTGTS